MKEEMRTEMRKIRESLDRDNAKRDIPARKKSPEKRVSFEIDKVGPGETSKPQRRSIIKRATPITAKNDFSADNTTILQYPEEF